MRIAERAQPLLGQRAPEIQPYGTLAQYPIALDEGVRAASVEALNQILADTMMLRDLYARLPFVDATFDTTLISLALHHCADPEGVLDEGIRVTRFRLIILESVYRNQWERFCLERFDSWLNRYRYGGNMQTPLAFKKPEEWQQMFDARPADRRQTMVGTTVGATGAPAITVGARKGCFTRCCWHWLRWGSNHWGEGIRPCASRTCMTDVAFRRWVLVCWLAGWPRWR